DDASLAALPTATRQPSVDSPEQAIGTIYVMEGSTHGAQYISKRLAAHFNLDGNGLRFYEGYGKDTMPQWQAFKTYLDSAFDTARDGDTIVASAVHTFEALQDWMDD